jgi:hypothetical protein
MSRPAKKISSARSRSAEHRLGAKLPLDCNANGPRRCSSLRSFGSWARITVLVVTLGAASLVMAGEPQTAGASRAPMFANLPLYFEVNRGQADRTVQFLARGQACQFFVSPTEAILSLRKMDVAPAVPLLAGVKGGFSRATIGRPTPNPSQEGSAVRPLSVSSRAVRLQFVGANPSARVTGEGELPGKINYFIGNDPAQWHTGVSTFTRLRVEEIYPGVNLVYYGNQQRLEYDFVVAPHADPAAIAIRFDGPEKIRVDARGDLVLSLGQDEIRQPKPTIFQDVRGVKKEISGGYQLTDQRTVTFKIGDYDRTLPLVIDPVLSYSTFLGGSASDTAWAVAVDTNGFVYVAGETSSAQLATPGAFQTNNAGVNIRGDAFVAKFDNTASSLVYLSYLGGQLDDSAVGLAVDGAGSVYLTGFTDSTNFPLKSAIYTNLSGSPYPGLTILPTDAFVVKLDSSGSNLVYSTYLGGSGVDLGRGIAIDPAGNAYVAGYTESTNFPTVSALSTNYGGLGDAFVAKINPAGTALVYSTYLGGSNQDVGNDIAADAEGNAYVTGYTSSTNFPVVPTNAAQSLLNNLTNASTAFDAFITKLTPAGDALVYSTFLGGTNNDFGYRLALDSDANVYVTGSSLSGDFPMTTTNLASAVVSNSVLSDVFVTKLAASGTNWIYSVLFGGDGKDEGWDIVVDSARNAHVVGATSSLNFPTNNTSGFLRGANSGGTDAFVAELNSNGTSLIYSAYLGGAGEDLGYGIAVDAAGNVYIVGETTSADFPTLFALQPAFRGVKDGFLAKIVPEPTLTATQSDGNVILAWRAFAPEFRLISNPGVTNPFSWTYVSATPVLTNGWHTVTLGATNSALFFRLYLP